MKNYILIIFIPFIFACQTGNNENIEDRDKMIDMIIDLHSIKEVVSIYPSEHKDSINSVLMNRFYELHGTDSLNVVNHFVEMRRNPELLKELHEEALEKVNRLILPQ